MVKKFLNRYMKRGIVLCLTALIAITSTGCCLLEWENWKNDRIAEAILGGLRVISSFDQDDYFINESQYYTGEQLEEIFYNNEEEFTEVAKIVQKNDAVQKSIDENDVPYARITPNSREFFTEKESEKITAFFEKVKPYEIEKYDAARYGYGQEGDSIIGILFPMNSEGQRVALYYINMPNEIEASFDRAQNYDILKKVSDYWWLGEDVDDNPLNDINLDNSCYENGEWHRKGETQENMGGS